MKGINIVNLIVYIVVTVALAVTTFLSSAVYGSWWFSALWVVFALVLALSIFATRMWLNAGRFILHLSLLAMLGGGLLTWITQTEGIVKIEPGESVTDYVDKKGRSHPLPTALKLERFETVYYPGGVVPRDYVSHLLVDGKKETVSMNNILDLKGYRVLQFSYDNEGATVLSVNHDPYGIFLSYAGYILFAIGGLWLLLSKNGRFRRLLKQTAFAAMLLSACSQNLSASTIAGVPRASADSLRSQQVLYNGRIVTFNTLAHDVILKIYGKESYRGLTPEQTLLSLKFFPDKWKDEQLILVKEKSVSDALGIDGKYACLSDLFDSDGNYKVERLYMTLGKDNVRAVENLDEKVGIILTLLSGELITPRPEDMMPLSENRVRMELVYNSIPFTKLIFMILFSGFIFGMIGYIVVRGNKSTVGALAWMTLHIPMVLLAIATCLSITCFVFQWYLSDRFPIANTFETLQFVVIMVEVILLVAARRNALLLPLGMLAAGALALVTHLVASNPVVTQLMPVLHSGWLSLHVTLVMTSYALLGFTFVVAVAGLVMPSSAERMRTLATCMLYPGVYLLGLGIFTGAVWANVSWGQYWSWDPKETWALITLLVYALPLHPSMLPLHKTKSFLAYMLFAILSIAMTYFGVNYLDSLHAYN